MLQRIRSSQPGPLIVAGLLVSALGCSHRCPSGTTLRGKSPPLGTAEWCEAGPRNKIASLPVPGRTFESSLDMHMDAARSVSNRELQGPMITWFATGQVRSHGDYSPSPTGGSEPDGLWTTFYKNGQIHSQGSFGMGTPVGCFSFWDEGGTQYSATWSAEDQLFHGTDCEGPNGTISEVVRSSVAGGSFEVLGDVGIQTFLTTGGFGIENHSFLVEKPGLSHNGEFYFRRYLDQLRFGGRVALRTSDDGDHESVLAATTFGYALPKLYESLELEVSGALGLQVIEAIPSDPLLNRRSLQIERFLELYTALETTVSWRLHDRIDLVATGRLEGGLPRSKNVSTTLCDANQCYANEEPATWDLGRYSAGVALGVRFLLR